MTNIKWKNVGLAALVILIGFINTTLVVKNNNLRSEINTLEKEKEEMVQKINDLRFEILELEMDQTQKQLDAKQDGD